MELSKQEFNNKLKEAVNQGYIYPAEAYDARKKFKRSGDTKILNTPWKTNEFGFYDLNKNAVFFVEVIA